jgi:predicted kinase
VSAPAHLLWRYILCGLPFAGKSTLAVALRQRFGYTIIAIDAINHERGLGIAAPIFPQDWDDTDAEAKQRLERTLAAGEKAIFDAPS